jgi:hypothetical protein
MRGFIEGLVYVIIVGQVPHLLGISGASGKFFTKLWHIFQQLSDVSVAPVQTGILSLTAMLLLRQGTGGARCYGGSNDLDWTARMRGDRCVRGRRGISCAGAASSFRFNVEW